MFFGRKKKTEVRVLKSTLVATFPAAEPPLIWKFDLQRNHSFTLALQGDSEGGGDEGSWELGATSPKGEFSPIARFTSRDDADEAFFRLQKALAFSQRPLHRKILRVVVLAGLTLFGFFVMMDILRTLALHNALDESQFVVPHGTPPAPVEMKDGVPQSADDVLKAPH